MTSGVLVVDKAPGMTSFDVVSLVRRRLGARRVGHGGTLDPDAMGVLPILIGEATKLMPFLQDSDKEYLATIRFGLTTDTQDLGGRVLTTSPAPPLTPDEVTRVTRAFVGRIKQVPPMYSAVHHEGQRLYELAREGREVERRAREVTVHAIVVEDVTPPTATIRVVCGKGTYVRALAADIGEALGCGAALGRLVRCRVGPFERSDALPSAAISTMSADEVWGRVRPPETVLAGEPALRLDARSTAAFLHGQAVDVTRSGGGRRFVATYGADGTFLGVGEWLAEGRRVKPARILHADRPGPRILPA